MDLRPWSLFLSLFIGSVGFGFFIYGRKQQRIPQLVAGILLMGYPYFVSNLWLMAGIAVLIVALVAVAVRIGW